LPSTVRLLSSSENQDAGAQDAASRLKEQAEQLRREVASFEQKKKEAQQAAQQLQEEERYQDER
jgi:DNA-binding transcriptional regulator GbsR (MarR family)